MNITIFSGVPVEKDIVFIKSFIKEETLYSCVLPRMYLLIVGKIVNFNLQTRYDIGNKELKR